MSNKLSSGDFNYASVDPDTASKLEYFATSGKALIRKSQIQFIADMGKILSEARNVMSQHGDGKFVKWATAEFDIGKQTVFNYVNAWDKCLSNGWTNYQNWSATAVYLASSDDIPSPVFKKLERLPSTGIIRSCDVKRIVDSSKPKPEPPAPTPVTTDSGDVPFDAVSTPAAKPLTQAELKAKERAAETAAKEKAKADAAAERARLKAEKDKAKADAAAAKEKAKADKEAAKAAAATPAGQIANLKNLINQHIGKIVRHLADLNRLKPNRAAFDASKKACDGIKLW